MGKTAIDAKRGTIFMLEPERLTLVTDKGHPLYDPRVEDPPDENMVANIAMHGVLEPVIVRKNGDAIEVVAGRGRTKAAAEANRRLKAEGKPPMLVPAIMRGGDDADLFGVMISENEIRREDSMIVKGGKARKLLNMGYSVPQIAVTFGATRQAVESWLAADGLPARIKDAVEAGEISATAALQASGLPRDEQVRRFEAAKSKGLKLTVHIMRDAVGNDPSGGDGSGVDGSGVDAGGPGGEAAGRQGMRPAPRRRTGGEIKKQLGSIRGEGGYALGYRDALLWALGLDTGGTEGGGRE